ncbi:MULTISPECIES: hypothetical protein [unclassified Undibacterium]|uniref:hypothetical protein n=1 Tax=unclassified Undibacterium TaxID=2630295 RepID=UPI002AC9BEB9|nr:MULTISPECIES: hypothetical protein [unclassified Undibacterium]MEB0140081.1 hypothetical protein [Undibacterium sp. CCC2.1]MEB0173191.1 hypothetical protein [Undibacterium sp. CCC1.1]MEB0176948.1 hypothetical protein [Undibacterium sp. CCC3.4]MEB0216281.1 hypothetical protein [Undibacterium sp. 5I2]WPX44184.1 hypothetical protein RHM61_02835 [Undibacterium sp. CCC3.4]
MTRWQQREEDKTRILEAERQVFLQNALEPMRLMSLRSVLAFSKKVWMYLFLVWMTFFCSVATIQISSEIKRQEDHFQQTSLNLYELIRQRLSQNEAVLGGLEALLHTFDQLQFNGVRAYAKEMLTRYPHIYTVGLL